MRATETLVVLGRGRAPGIGNIFGRIVRLEAARDARN
jgi:hypothetical protein